MILNVDGIVLRNKYKPMSMRIKLKNRILELQNQRCMLNYRARQINKEIDKIRVILKKKLGIAEETKNEKRN